MNGVFLTLLAFLPAAEQNWPQFRGPSGDGHAEAKDLPVHWSEERNVRWKTAIPGKAWASPVVWGSRVWLSNAPADGKELSVLAVNLASGKVELNIKVFDNPNPAYCNPVNSYASCTPCLEEGRVYVHYGSAGTACLDMTTGDILWSRRDLPCDHFRGPASSPILFGDNLYINFDGVDQQYIVALDKKTGRTVWKKTRNIDYKMAVNDMKKAYGTPTVIEVQGKPQLVSPAAAATISYDPLTGYEIWKVYHGGMNIPMRPVTGFGRVFLGSGDAPRSLLAVRTDGQGDVTGTHITWKSNKSASSRSSLLLIGDVLYMVDDKGIVSLIEAETGKQIRQERLQGAFWASPIYADGHIYFFNEEGAGYVVEPGREWKVLAANRLAGGCMASPAAVGRVLLVRTRTHLYCLEKKP